MDNKRLILFVALGFVLLLVWQAWVEDYAVQPDLAEAPPISREEQAGAPIAESDVPNVSEAPQAQAVPEAEEQILRQGQRVRVMTDVLHAEIDTLGGDLREVELLDYPLEADEPEELVHLLKDTQPNLFVAQSGLLAGARGPTHHAVFVPEQTEYRLGEGDKELHVRLNWRSPDGLKVTKIYTFRRNSYEIGVDYRVDNTTAEPWHGSLYGQFQRTYDESDQSFFIYTYTGGVISGPEDKYDKVDFDDMKDQDLSHDIQGGWAALLQHYFVAAWAPQQDELNHYYTKVLDGTRYILGLVTPEKVVPAGSSATLGIDLYVGPKLQDRLERVAPALELTVDYGFLTVLAQPLFWLLDYIHSMVGNWGWAIVILTLLIKLAFYKLSAASYRSMANMRRMQPRITALKERFGDDRQRFSQAMMEMYKKEKINPLGGCLPMLVQIPVFIALYWVLLESVELRHADFLLWINDLSSPDPYYVLPLLMGATMFLQQKLSPAPPDPLQAKVMSALPIIFTLFFAFFPAGLVLYWVANNTLSIAQQWHITRKLEMAHK